MYLKRIFLVCLVFISIHPQCLQSNEECQANLALVHKMWSLGDTYMLENISDFFADRIDVHSVNTHGTPIGLDRETLVQWEQQRVNAIPGVWHPIDVFAFDDKVVAYCKCTGVHQGDLLDLPATYKPFTIYGMIMFRFNNSKICETWSSWDRMSLIEQLK